MEHNKEKDTIPTIETIVFEDVLPQVFAMEPDRHASQVWKNSLSFEKGKKYMVEAASGTGKSSMCSFIYGNRKDYSGVIRFNDRDIKTISIDDWCKIRCRHLALLPQEMRLFPELTALENVLIKNTLTHHKELDQIKEMFQRLGISDKLDSRADHLSIGQQQRVAIIRCLCQPFDFILLDEPVSHLDAGNNRIVSDLITAQAKAQGAGIITTSVGNPLDINPDIVVKL